MLKKRPSPIPRHLTAITPRLVVPDGLAAIAFYKKAFGAKENRSARFQAPSGQVIHAEMLLGDATFFVTEDNDPNSMAQPPALAQNKVTAIMATYWPDVDRAWARAIKAGVEIIFPIDDQFYGERGGRVRDPFGHQWMMSMIIEELTPAEIKKRAKKAMA